MQAFNRRRAIAVAVALAIASAGAFSGCGGDDPMEPRTLAIAISPDPVVLPRVGAVLQLTVTEEATDGSRDITFDTATAYSSSNTSVSGVISSGEVVATGIGEAFVIARNGAFTDTAVARVDTLASVGVASLAITPESATLRAVDETRPTLGTIEWVNGARLRNIAGAPIAYSSSDDGVATVDANGVITARADGSATIRAIFNGAADSAAITVNTAPPVSFQQQILPLFTAGASRCNDPSCHPANGAAQRNLRMTTYSNIMDGGSVNGPIVIPGDGASSWLVRVLRPGGAPQIATNQMPQNKTKFSATTIDLIERWIDEGAENN
ncbi:MAG: Ig-like domain-containing protein [bacterium]